mgnify:CR=1 FL=1
MFYIYETRNNLNGKNYIGQRKCPENKIPETDTFYKGSGYFLRSAFKKYGINNFSKSILAITETKVNADILEKYFIKLFRESGKAEYNIADGGQGGLLNEYHRQCIIKSNLSRKLSEESKLKISNALKGHKESEETKRRKSLSHKGLKVWNKGIKYSEELCHKLSESQKGKKKKPFTQEHRKHLSEAMKKRPVSEEVKERLRTAYLGKHHSEEYKKKMSELMKGKPSHTKGKHWKIVDGKRIYQ